MNQMTRLLVLTILGGHLAFGAALAAEDHVGHTHSVGGLEIGFSVGYVHLEEDRAHHDAFEHEDHSTTDHGVGLHVHVGKTLGEEGILAHISAGIAGEVIFADHEHYALMGFASIHPWRGLVLTIGPGVEWTEHEDQWESSYSTHLEAAYTFELEDIHLGPFMGYSWTDDAEHYTTGIHIGVHL